MDGGEKEKKRVTLCAKHLSGINNHERAVPLAFAGTLHQLLLKQTASRLEAIAIRGRPSLLGWRPSLVGWRLLLLVANSY